MAKIVQNLDSLVALAHHRWNIQVIAELQRSNGAKHVTLLNRLKLGRASLSASLKHLTRLGLVRRNTGYGHPMRPEYLLTGPGQEMGPECRKLVSLVQRRDAEPFAYSKWTFPVVAAIGAEMIRYGEIRSRLETASPRALAMALKRLQVHGWVDRTIVSEYPLAAGYRLTPASKPIFRSLELICASMA